MSEEKNVVLPEEEVQQDVNELRQVRVDKLEAMQAAGKDPFVITTADQQAHTADLIRKFEEIEKYNEENGVAAEDSEVINTSICGRIMAWRDMGKANFIVVEDKTGKLQVYVRINDIGEEAFAEFKKWDIGDIVGVEGFVSVSVPSVALVIVTSLERLSTLTVSNFKGIVTSSSKLESIATDFAVLSLACCTSYTK